MAWYSGERTRALSGRLRERARLIYHDLRGRNATVRISVATEDVATTNPIFILSPYRSGTTLLRYILDSHSRIACPPESDFLHIVAGVLHDEEAMLSLASMGYSHEHVAQRVRAFSEYFFANYAQSKGKERWADKSPAYLPHWADLREVFPDSVFLILYRHPLDQIESFTKSGTTVHSALKPFLRPGEDPRRAAARYWNASVGHQRSAALASPGLEVLYERLCERPEEELRRLFSYLGEPFEPAVLRFNEMEHDLGKESVRIRGTRGFEPRLRTYTHWDARLIDDCWRIVEDNASALGYSRDGWT